MGACIQSKEQKYIDKQQKENYNIENIYPKHQKKRLLTENFENHHNFQQEQEVQLKQNRPVLGHIGNTLSRKSSKNQKVTKEIGLSVEQKINNILQKDQRIKRVYQMVNKKLNGNIKLKKQTLIY